MSDAKVQGMDRERKKKHEGRDRSLVSLLTQNSAK